MKIKKIISSDTKENGKFDLSLITENDKNYMFSNCEIIGDNEETETNTFNLKFYYDYVHLQN
jgi:hypothetical protein